MKEKLRIVSCTIAQLFETMMKDLGIADYTIFASDLELLIHQESKNRNPTIHFKPNGTNFPISIHGVSAVSISDTENQSGIYSRFDKASEIFIEDDNYIFDFKNQSILKALVAEENKRLILCTRN